MKKTFDISGMNCAACVANVEKNVKKLPGIHQVEVNLLTNSMQVSHDDSIDTQTIIAAVIKAGYGAKIHDGSKVSIDEVAHTLKWRFLISLCFLLPLMYFSMGAMFSLPTVKNAAFIQLGLCTLILLVNYRYFVDGFQALFRFSPNMDSLTALGAFVAFFYSLVIFYQNGKDYYFESAAMIVTFITLGRFLEHISKGKTGSAIQSLLNLAPKTALRLKNGKEEEILLSEIQVGDTLSVKPGMIVPADGIILEGASAINESAITGESVPIEKTKGDFVTGATLNTNGYFTLLVKRIGQESTLSKIIELVEKANASKAPIGRLADKISGIFVPLVILLSISIFLLWFLIGKDFSFCLSKAICVLIISCPCALGLATPVAIMVGVGRGAKEGILYKDAQTLENLCHTQTFVFDKTGTITKGEPQLTQIIALNGQSENEVLQLAMSLEAKSEHPFAKAILNEGGKRGLTLLPLEDFQALSGLGIKASYLGKLCLIGNYRFLEENQIKVNQDFDGQTPIYLAYDKKLVAIFALMDRPREKSREAILMLKERLLKVIMLTGDYAKTAERIRKEVGIDEAISEVLPQDKHKTIERLQKQGQKVAMVGDGINDAPALSQANVGIAIRAGSDVAIESAHLVLMKNDLTDIVFAYDLSKATLKTIKTNLFWAFFYNIVCIPIAAGLLYPYITFSPAVAAIAMSLSSLFVITNALRLNLLQRKTLLKKDEAMTKTIHIEGMNCMHCKASVEKALNALDGISATVNLEKKEAYVKANQSVSDEQITKAITDAGFQVTHIS